MDRQVRSTLRGSPLGALGRRPAERSPLLRALEPGRVPRLPPGTRDDGWIVGSCCSTAGGLVHATASGDEWKVYALKIRRDLNSGAPAKEWSDGVRQIAEKTGEIERIEERIACVEALAKGESNPPHPGGARSTLGKAPTR